MNMISTTLFAALILLNGRNQICDAQTFVHILRGPGMYLSECDVNYKYSGSPPIYNRIHIAQCVPRNNTFAEDIRARDIDVSAVIELNLEDVPNVPRVRAELFEGITPRKLTIDGRYGLTVTPEANFLESLPLLEEIEVTRVIMPPFPKLSMITIALLQEGNSTGEYGGCMKLQSLTVINWSLPNLDKGWLSNCSHLTKLILTNMSIEDVKKSIVNVKTLKSLALHELNLLEFPVDIFKDLNKLRQLTMSNNNLQSIHRDTFKGLSSLEDLDLSNNQLTMLKIAGSFFPLRSLTYLILANNPDLTQDINAENCTRQLFFGDSAPQLALISLHKTGFPKTCAAKILGNDTVESRVNALQALFSIGDRKMMLQDYPVTCDCKNLDLVSLIQIHHKQVTDFQDVTCQDSKGALRDVVLKKLCGTPAKKTVLIAATACSVIIFVIVLFIAIYYFRCR